MRKMRVLYISARSASRFATAAAVVFCFVLANAAFLHRFVFEKMEPVSIEDAVITGKLALVIEGFENDTASLEILSTFNHPLTFVVEQYDESTAEFSRKAHELGHEIVLKGAVGFEDRMAFESGDTSADLAGRLQLAARSSGKNTIFVIKVKPGEAQKAADSIEEAILGFEASGIELVPVSQLKTR